MKWEGRGNNELSLVDTSTEVFKEFLECPTYLN